MQFSLSSKVTTVISKVGDKNDKSPPFFGQVLEIAPLDYRLNYDDLYSSTENLEKKKSDRGSS